MSKEKREFMRFVSQTEEEAVIEIYGTIGGWDWDTLSRINTIESVSEKLNKIKALKSKQITVTINSEGGLCNDALAIHDALRDHPAKIITKAIGVVMSAATIIFLAGDERKMSKNAVFLIHKCASRVSGNENDLIEELEVHRGINELMLNIYKSKSNKSKEDIASLMNENNGIGKYIYAQETLDYGFATEIYNEEKPAKVAINKKYFDSFKFPPLPEGYNFDAEEKEPAWMERLVQKFTDIFKPTNPITMLPTLYFNEYHKTVSRLDINPKNIKIGLYYDDDFEKRKEDFNTHLFLNWSSSQWTPELKEHLFELFPEKSRFEISNRIRLN